MPESPLVAADKAWAAPVSALSAAAIVFAPLITISASAWQGKPVPIREWLVSGLIPIGCVTALYGDGGVGKSLLAQQLMTACASGKAFLGLPTMNLKTLGVFCEDSADELHRRQDAINRAENLEYTELTGIDYLSRVGQDNTLMTFIQNDAEGKIEDFYGQLRQTALVSQARLIVIDTAADTFGGNEIIRPQVRQFINLLNRLAIEINGAVLLCAHPSAAGLISGEGTGGSTAWNNTVRARIYLQYPKADSEDDPQDLQDLRILTTKKSNYGKTGDQWTLRWHEGAFKLCQPSSGDLMDSLEKSRQEREDDVCFLQCLDALTAQGRNVSASKNAGNYAAKEMHRKPEVKGMSKARIIATMERLFAAQVIVVGEVGRTPDRKPKQGIRRVKTLH